MKLLKHFTTLVTMSVGLAVGISLWAGCAADRGETDSAEEKAASIEATMVYYAMPG